ncbi:hypothetical protein J6590_049609 [Homalodisca vitripennis]|nr:hypothetical protein J6590_049609 [Homalodisca vitripennis]
MMRQLPDAAIKGMCIVAEGIGDLLDRMMQAYAFKPKNAISQSILSLYLTLDPVYGCVSIYGIAKADYNKRTFYSVSDSDPLAVVPDCSVSHTVMLSNTDGKTDLTEEKKIYHHYLDHHLCGGKRLPFVLLIN